MVILLVDDEAEQRRILGDFLKKQGHCILEAGNGSQALQQFMQQPIELVLLDHRMPDMNGDEVLARMKEMNPTLRAIMITAYGAVDTAVRTMQLGADDFLEKPLDLQQLLERIQKIEEELLVSRDAEQVEETLCMNDLPVRLIGSSHGMRHALSIAFRAASAPWTVLIRGETGTGKELFARLIHLLSPRKDSPFIELNCAAVPENLFESELFGHERGAFTGAANRRKGVFEQADQGTLFLDEVGELPLAMQPKLLRALQEKRIMRVGGERPVEVDVRIIAATNRDLRAMVEKKTFREDLYFRLNVIELEIPPLRKRKEDLPELIDFFLQRFNSDRRFDSQAMAQLAKYSFPGNVRELEHIIQRSTTLARSSVITLRDLPSEVREYRGPSTGGSLNARLAEAERRMLLDALEEANWIQTSAAGILGISERVLRYKMNKHNIRKIG